MGALKYLGQKPRHRYEVSLTRRVHVPEYGPEAHYLSSRTVAFGFGSGQQFANGAAAEAAATAYAERVAPLASEVSLTRCNGYGGTCRYIKDSRELFFSDWPDAEAIE